jgi:FixJ family two-component response regulator
MLRPHVIIVDDDSAACASVCALLKVFDFDVTSFDSAEAFLAANAKPEGACLLIDVQLPGMSGRELQKTLKQKRRPPPVILISGYVDSAMTTLAVEDGAVAVLEKPINPRTLVDHIQLAFRYAAQSEENEQTN